MNVFWHAANSLLLLVLLRRMTAAPWRSAGVAALFALHPLHVESVAWVSARKDVLNTFFLLLAMYAYVRYVERPGRARYWTSVGMYGLALMSKAMGVTLPFVLLLLDYWPLRRMQWTKPSVKRRLAEKIPFFAMALPASAAAYWAEGSTLVPLEHFPLGLRLANVALSYVGYIGKTVWPVGLAIFYPLRSDLSGAAATAAGIGLMTMTAAALRYAGRRPWWPAGWFWYLATLAPVIGLVQIGTYSMADRYTYWPLIGLFVLLCWSLPARAMAAVATAAAIAGCGALARLQVGHWKNSETVFRHAVAVTRENWLAHVNLGVALKEAGKSREEEMEQYRQALRIRPNCAEAHHNLAAALWEAGEREQAVAHWSEALRLRPQYEEAHASLGEAWLRLGKVTEAVRHLEQAWGFRSDRAESYNDLGAAAWRAGEIELAIACYERALQIHPQYAEAHYNLAGALEQQGRLPEAVAHYEEALRIRPGLVEAQERLARLRAAGK
jgi:tetratricopeptide (TPR) repeat protein